MYHAKDIAANTDGPALRVAQATVEGSLLKSRLITNRWLGQVSKKKRELEQKMFKMQEMSMVPYNNEGFSTISGAKESTDLQIREGDYMNSTQ